MTSSDRACIKMNSISHSGFLVVCLSACVLSCSKPPGSTSDPIPGPSKPISLRDADNNIVMSGTVPPGYRGIALPVPSWQAQFISPGNRIDVIATLAKDHPGRPKEDFARTVLQNALVLDVRKPLRDGEPSAIELALNPKEAQHLALAISEGGISVALRSDEDAEMHPMDMTSCKKLFR